METLDKPLAKNSRNANLKEHKGVEGLGVDKIKNNKY